MSRRTRLRGLWIENERRLVVSLRVATAYTRRDNTQ